MIAPLDGRLPGQSALTAVSGRNAEGIAAVLDLLAGDAPLEETLVACACFVPTHLGSAAVVALDDDDEPILAAPPGTPASRLSIDDRWWRQAVDDGKARIPLDFAHLPVDLSRRARAEGFESAWVLPVPQRDGIPGCLVIWLRPFVVTLATTDDVRQALRLVQVAVHVEALRRQASTDPLTGLANRHGLAQRLNSVPDPVTVAMVDLDGFKSINDTHGHTTGDAVLQVIAARIRGTVRRNDLVVRWGGDEFTVIFADDDAEIAVRRIADSIENPIRLEGLTLRVSATIGLATSPRHDYSTRRTPSSTRSGAGLEAPSEWRRLARSPRARRALMCWKATRPALAGVSVFEDLLTRRRDPDAAPALLAAPAALTPNDHLATRVLLQALVPGLVRLSHTAGHGDANALDDMITLAWERIATYPTTRHGNVAANVLRDVRKRYRQL